MDKVLATLVGLLFSVPVRLRFRLLVATLY